MTTHNRESAGDADRKSEMREGRLHEEVNDDAFAEAAPAAFA